MAKRANGEGSITQSEVPQGFVMVVPIYVELDGSVAKSIRTATVSPSGTAVT